MLNLGNLGLRVRALAAKVSPTRSIGESLEEPVLDEPERATHAALLFAYVDVLRGAAERAGLHSRGFWPPEAVLDVVTPAEYKRLLDLDRAISTRTGREWAAARLGVRRRHEQPLGIDVKLEMAASRGPVPVPNNLSEAA